jgi:hypothetical protein
MNIDVPRHILELAERLRTQDNLCTEHPMWNVQVKGKLGQWITVKSALTRKGIDEYLAIDGHNLKGHRVWVDGMYRCFEMIALREWLMTLKEETK